MQIVHGAILKQSSQTKYQLLEVAFMRSRLLCIHMLALNNQELEKIYQTPIVMTVQKFTPGMTMVVTLTINLDKWGFEKLFQTSDKVIIRELKIYVEYWEILNIKNKIQLSRTMLWKSMTVWIFMTSMLIKDWSLITKKFNYMKMMAGL